MLSSAHASKDGSRALLLFDVMRQQAPLPNPITYIALISACEEGRVTALQLFDEM